MFALLIGGVWQPPFAFSSGLLGNNDLDATLLYGIMVTMQPSSIVSKPLPLQDAPVVKGDFESASNRFARHNMPRKSGVFMYGDGGMS